MTLLRNASLDSGYIFCVSLLVVGRPTSYSLTYRSPVSVTGGAVWRSVHSRCLGCFCPWVPGRYSHELLVSGRHFFSDWVSFPSWCNDRCYGPDSAEHCLDVYSAVLGQGL